MMLSTLTRGLQSASPIEPGWATLGGMGRFGEAGEIARLGLKARTPDSKRNVPSACRVAGRAASPAFGSFLEKFTARRVASSWLPASRMMYHAGFGPDGVFTAPLKRGSVIVPLGLPLGTFMPVSASIGMSNLPDFNNWTGPASSGSASESAGGNWDMSTFVPVDAKGGMMLHPGPGPLAAGPGPFPASTTRPSRRPSPSCLPCADAAPGRSMPVASAIAETHAIVLRPRLLPSQLG